MIGNARSPAAFVLVLVMLAAPARGLAAAKPAVEDVVRRLQERYDRTSDFVADFRQTVEVPTLERALESNGRVFYKRPGRMRWEFQKPEQQTIVADGTTLWVYQPEQEQVLKAPFRAAFRSTTPVSFLFGVGKLEQDFRPSVMSADEQTVRLRLEPKKKDADIGLLVLTVARETWDIRGAEVTDPLGNVTRLEFTNLEREVGLEDGRFRFDVPDGVDVVESPDLFGGSTDESGALP